MRFPHISFSLDGSVFFVLLLANVYESTIRVDEVGLFKGVSGCYTGLQASGIVLP